jgi:hypothetical protein
MSSFDEFVHENFDAHLRVVTEAGGVPRKRARSVVAAIRRRRAVRAGAATGVSLLTVGAVAVGAMALRPAEDAAPVGPPSPSASPAPYVFPTPPAGAPAWCDLSAYPAVNPDALGALRYDGRVYADYVRNVFVYVAPDGTHQVLQPDANGETSIEPPDGGSNIYVPMGIRGLTFAAFDYSQGGAGGQNLSDSEDPGLMYEWTTTVPDTIPAGVGINNLSQQLAIILGLGGEGFNPSAYPDGALVEQVFRWTDGHERVEKLSAAGPGPSLQDYAGLASVSVRVSNLPGGEVFEITSTFDPTKTWSAACVAGGSAPSSTRTVVTPTATPYLEGPESAVFRCLAPLPAKAEDALPTAATLESGERWVSYSGIASEFDINGSTFDFGSRGVLVTSDYELSRSVVDFEYKQELPGWGSQWGNIDQTPSPDGSTSGNGVVTFTALAWVDADGVIVGREVVTTDPDGLYVGSGSRDGVLGPEVGGRMQVSYVVPNVDTLGVACGGAVAGALDSANLVWLEGAGPDLDHMTWSWTRVSPTSAN